MTPITTPKLWSGLVVAAASLFGGCTGGHPQIDGKVSTAECLAMAQRHLDAGEVELAALASEAVIQRAVESEAQTRALYLAGIARQANEQPSRAFEHFRTLAQDHPLSEWVPEIEAPLYQIGRDYFARPTGRVFGDTFTGRSRGMEVLLEFVATFPRSELADDALAAMADFQFERREYDLAAAYYRRVIEDYHPSSGTRGERPFGVSADRLIGDRAALQLGESWLLYSRGAGYDHSPLLRAAAAFRDYLSREAPAEPTLAEERLALCLEELAQSELEVARFYLGRGRDRGARVHFANATLAYPGTSAAMEAARELEARGWDRSVHSVDTLIAEAEQVERSKR